MKKIIDLIVIITVTLFLSSILFSSSLIKKAGDSSFEKKKTTLKNSKTNGKKSNNIINESDGNTYEPKTKIDIIEETTNILGSRLLGNINLNHDDHIYKILKIAHEGKNIQGAVDLLIESKTKLGKTLDNDEVEILIKLSKIDTNFYNEVIAASKNINNKKTSISEHFTICREFEIGNARYLLLGIERAANCNFRLNDDIFTREEIEILIKYGKIKDEERLFEVYNSLKSIGMNRKTNLSGLEVIYKFFNITKNIQGAVEVIVESKTKIGNTFDDEEIAFIVKLSRLDTKIYNEVIAAARKIYNKKTSIIEHNKIIGEFVKGNGNYLLLGIDRAANCNFRINNDNFTQPEIDLLIKIGKLSNKERFLNIYNSLRNIGMKSNVDSSVLKVIYNFYYIQGDAASKIDEYSKIYSKKPERAERKKYNYNSYIKIGESYFYYNEKYFDKLLF